MENYTPPLTLPELHRLSDEITQSMMDLYGAGLTLREVGLRFKCGPEAVYSRIRLHPDYASRPRGKPPGKRNKAPTRKRKRLWDHPRDPDPAS